MNSMYQSHESQRTQGAAQEWQRSQGHGGPSLEFGVGVRARGPRRGILRTVALRLGEALQRWANRGAERLSEAGERLHEWSERGAEELARGGRQMRRGVQPDERGMGAPFTREVALYGRIPGLPREPGPFQGRGPKGYRRADERVAEDVCEILALGYVDASDIEVQVDNGEVTLRGTVHERQAKRIAEDLLEGVSGIKDVHNELRVRPAAERETSDRFAQFPEAGQRH